MKNKKKKSFWERVVYLSKSFKVNYIFWIVITICIFLISCYHKKDNLLFNFISGYMSLILAILIGYGIHYISHLIDLTKIYNNKCLKNYPTLNKIINKSILYTWDFHDKIHHNVNDSKTFINLLIEFIQNILTQGLLFIIVDIFILSFMITLNFKIINKIFNFIPNKAIILLWALFYSTIHIINYNILNPIQHRQHHKHQFTNLDPVEFTDIIFDTKYDYKYIQDYNHGSINIIIITILIIYFKIFI